MQDLKLMTHGPNKDLSQWHSRVTMQDLSRMKWRRNNIQQHVMNHLHIRASIYLNSLMCEAKFQYIPTIHLFYANSFWCFIKVYAQMVY